MPRTDNSLLLLLITQNGKTLEEDTSNLLKTWSNSMNWESCQEPCSWTGLMKAKVLRQLWLPMRPSGITHACFAMYNNTMLRRAEKRTHPSRENTRSDDDVLHKRSRLRPSNTEANSSKGSCFFCGQPGGSDGLNEASTFQIDRRVRESAAHTAR